ncbi:hypothetical protein LY76DRAFT_589864 [Colletotrichum caudatum]|nr:hypothetical protein LY76DRAFT_589864 [Colletotrichum caudatum]
MDVFPPESCIGGWGLCWMWLRLSSALMALRISQKAYINFPIKAICSYSLAMAGRDGYRGANGVCRG